MASPARPKADDAAKERAAKEAVDRQKAVALLTQAFQIHQSGQIAKAGDLYLEVLKLDPRNADALHLLGLVARNAGNNESACQLMQKAVTIQPAFPDAHYNLGNALSALGRFDKAAESYRAALTYQPKHTMAAYNLGNVLRSADRLDEAVEAYHQALAADPQHVESLHNLANTLKDKGDVAEAISSFKRTLELKPGLPEAHYNLGLCLLLASQLPEGFKEYEWRWQVNDFTSPKRNFKPPQWKGEALKGKTILLHAEQGYGDTLQFVRYAPLVAARGGKVIVEIQPALMRVLAGIKGVSQFVPAGDALPAFDFHCPLVSLPMVFGTDLPTVPAPIPYVGIDIESAKAWAKRLGPRKGLRVGLVWAGNPKHTNDRRRSLKPDAFKPLGAVPGIEWYSLQVGPGAVDIGKAPPRLNLIDLSPHLTDFAETAAALANLDLLISVDTAPVHLAGALGKPTWLLLPYVPDWRWMRERTDTPWYPSMRLFRQPEAGRWDAVLMRMTKVLADWALAAESARKKPAQGAAGKTAGRAPTGRPAGRQGK